MTEENQYKYSRKKKGFFFLLIVPAILLLLGAVVMFLWNAIITVIASVPAITYWQAFGLLILCRILFGGFRFGHGGKPSFKEMPWKDKWTGMNEEERDKFKEEWKKRCGHRKV